MAANNPVAFVVKGVGRDLRGAAMGGAVNPAVAAEIEPAVDLPRRVMPVGQLQQLPQVGELPELRHRRIVFVNERIPGAR